MSVLESLISIIAPACCCLCGAEGSALCKNCRSSFAKLPSACYRCNRLTDNFAVCLACRKQVKLKHIWYVTNYDELAIKIIHAFKFDHQRSMAGPLSALMATLVKSPPGAMLVPVPSATRRVRQRGFDHTKLMAQELSKPLGLEEASALGRLGQTKQVGSTRDQRLAQPQGKYWVKQDGLVRNRDIILVDDVVTTGATLQAAATALKIAGAGSVSAVVFARKL